MSAHYLSVVQWVSSTVSGSEDISLFFSWAHILFISPSAKQLCSGFSDPLISYPDIASGKLPVNRCFRDRDRRGERCSYLLCPRPEGRFKRQKHWRHKDSLSPFSRSFIYVFYPSFHSKNYLRVYVKTYVQCYCTHVQYN